MTTRERQLEMGSEMMLVRINEMKASLNNLILKVELDHDNFTFPDALDSFAVISGQMNTVMKLLRSDRLPLLKEVTAIPLLLNPDKDPELLALTEGRLEFFNHAVVPDYLRTKPDPNVEKEHERVELRGSQQNPDTASKQAANLTKMANNLLQIITSNLNDWETSSERAAPPSTSSMAETQELVSSVFTGKAFRVPPPNLPMQRQGSSSASPTAVPVPQPKGVGGTIKTTIKPAGRNY